MIRINFGGWAQCRLATDPDPYDEPRGVSGYIRAFVGEPDLDRIIRLNDPPLKGPTPRTSGSRCGRSMGPAAASRPSPGRSAGEPCRRRQVRGPQRRNRRGRFRAHLSIRPQDQPGQRTSVEIDGAGQSGHSDREFLCTGATTGEFERIVAATGIRSIVRLWRERLAKLEFDLAQRPSLTDPRSRSASTFSSASPWRAGALTGNFLMPWNYALRSKQTSAPGRRRSSARFGVGRAMAGRSLVRRLGRGRPGLLRRRRPHHRRTGGAPEEVPPAGADERPRPGRVSGFLAGQRGPTLGSRSPPTSGGRGARELHGG